MALEVLRLLFRATGKFTDSSLTTIIGLNRKNELLIDATYRRFWEDLPLELSLLAAAVVDFTDDSIKFGVKDAFYGLKKFSRPVSSVNPHFSTVRNSLSDLIHLVWLLAEGRDGLGRSFEEPQDSQRPLGQVSST